MADDNRPTVREVILEMFGWPTDALAFDPLDYETWPQRLRDRAGEVADGLDNGDLGPLAAYLQEGFPLPTWLSLQLADAINPRGGGRYKVGFSGRKTGEQGERKAAARHSRNYSIGAYVAYYIHKHGRGQAVYDSAIADAREKFGLGEKSSAPAQHYAKFRAVAFKEDGSISPFHASAFSDLRWKHYPFKRSR